MAELFLIENSEENAKCFSDSNETSLHGDMLEVLFKYKNKIYNRFDDVRGTFLIDHLAINVINSNKQVLIFSTTPSVEYNLISQDLWKYDRSFSASYQSSNKFYSWEKAYAKKYFDELRLIKQINHGFSYGFNLSKKIGSCQFVYSFATRCQKPNLLEYYNGHISELFAIGNYSYNAIREIYEERFGKIVTDTGVDSSRANRPFPPFLKLISNNK